jgi:hypothetical protein
VEPKPKVVFSKKIGRLTLKKHKCGRGREKKGVILPENHIA